jgi:beta-lactamase regulating signal transducer with metallopeptidase domain
MFALREIAVSLAFFVLLYCALSALVSLLWRGAKWLRPTERNLADFLFLLRVLPLFASILITLAIVVPSFQLLEPRSTNEGVGTMPIALGLGALFLISIGCYRAVAAQTRTSRIVELWIESSRQFDKSTGTFSFHSRPESPPLVVAGVRKPRVLVSDAALEVLAPEELRIALRHELAHVRSYDNLKKLVFRFAPFPGMAKLEGAWSQASELAADDAAVSNLNEAVDLATALVKLSRLLPVDAMPACTTGFVSGSLSLRVTRLLAWNPSRVTQGPNILHWAALPPALAAVFFAFLSYGPVLGITHGLTEWLVR